MITGGRPLGRGEYRVVVPVLALGRALPRFDAPPDVRRTLAIAFAVDTLRAAIESRRAAEVIVATPDPLIASIAVELGAAALPGCHGDRLEVLAASAREAARDLGLRGPTAVLVGTLPSLVSEELDAALAPRNAQRTEFLDLGSSTSTLWADSSTWPSPPRPIEHDPAAPYRPARPSGILPGLACDVATAEGLRIAHFLGVGDATAAAVERLGIRMPDIQHAS